MGAPDARRPTATLTETVTRPGCLSWGHSMVVHPARRQTPRTPAISRVLLHAASLTSDLVSPTAAKRSLPSPRACARLEGTCPAAISPPRRRTSHPWISRSVCPAAATVPRYLKMKMPVSAAVRLPDPATMGANRASRSARAPSSCRCSQAPAPASPRRARWRRAAQLPSAGRSWCACAAA